MNIKQIKKAYEKKDNTLYGSSRLKELMGILYHENSKLDQYTARQQGESIAYFSDPYLTDRYTKPYKRYFEHESHQFDNKTIHEDEDEFFKLITSRRSARAFDPDYSVSLRELEHMLYYSYGVTRKESINDNGGFMGYRNIPSAGGLYPLEIYVCLFNSHIEQGLYHYNEVRNCLSLVKAGNHVELLRNLVKAEPWIELPSASGVILISGMIERQAIKYGERSYRFMQQETGFLAYLISLITHHIGLGSCMAGAFIDQELNNFMEIDGNFETVLCPIIFGKNKT